MERYTYFEDGKWRLRVGDTEYSGPEVDRLAAYEDTGLEPEDFKTAFDEDAVVKLAAQALGTTPDRLRELVKAQHEGLVVVLATPRKPLVWGDDDHETCLCPDCGADLMGIPYGERMILQCPVCGQYVDTTEAITRAEAEAALSCQTCRESGATSVCQDKRAGYVCPNKAVHRKESPSEA